MFAIAQKVYACGLKCASHQVWNSGMIYSGKENIPLLMFLRGDGPAAGERFIQQFKAGHAQNGKLTPVWETAAAALACGLIREEIHDPFLNAIILRLHDSRFIVI
jgi:hypothetical protein